MRAFSCSKNIKELKIMFLVELFSCCMNKILSSTLIIHHEESRQKLRQTIAKYHKVLFTYIARSRVTFNRVSSKGSFTFFLRYSKI